MTKVKVDPDLGAIPEIKQTYWYVRSCYYKPFGFVLIEEEWTGSTSDLYRLTKGNVYLDKAEADKVVFMLNQRFEQLQQMSVDARQKERLAEEAAKKKAEAAERKRLREEEKKKKKLSQSDKAKQYENNKKRKKSPHPDIVI